MKIGKNSVVAISYELEVEGQIADKAGSDSPLEYMHGTGMLLPKFEAELEGKEEGEPFAFTLAPEEGYGPYRPEYRINTPTSTFNEESGFMSKDVLFIGSIVPVMSSDNHFLFGRIVSIDEENVTIDCNHAMAGKTLNFSGKVESVRAATEKELAHGLHGDEECGCGGCGGEDCGCGNCGCGDCGDGGCGDGECKCGGC